MSQPDKTILLVEDDDILRRAIRTTLEKRGYRVIVAVDGIEALLRIRDTSPDLVLLDLLMPRMGGMQVLAELAVHDEVRLTRIIIFSNSSCEDGKRTALELGAADYLVKSDISPRELCEKVAGYLQRRPDGRDDQDRSAG